MNFHYISTFETKREHSTEKVEDITNSPTCLTRDTSNNCGPMSYKGAEQQNLASSAAHTDCDVKNEQCIA